MADTPIFVFSKKYVDSLSKLPPDVQGKFAASTMLFLQNPNHPSLYVKPWMSGGKASGVSEFRISDYYRCLFRDLNHSIYLFIYACGHNETNSGKKMKAILGGTYDPDNLDLLPDEETIDQITEELEKLLSPEEKKQPGLFAGLSESSFRKLHIPECLIKPIRVIRTREQLETLFDILPENVRYALDFISEGDSVEDVVETLFGTEEPESDTASVKDPVTASGFVSISTPEDYERYLAAPLEAWRIYLHPEQKRLSQKMFAGPAKVTGGAGTGKTVTAMHRAKWLAEQLPAGKKILITTFTRNLAEDISENLDRLIADKAVRDRIEVSHFDSWAVNYFNTHQRSEHVAYDNILGDVWQAAYKQNSDPSLSLDFYKDEWDRVLLRYEIFDRDGYRTVTRSGRPQLKGGIDKRDEVWQVFQAFIDLCKKKRHLDIGRLMIKCRQMIEESGEAPYDSIVVDEGQDLSVQAYRLLRAMAGPEHENDLFIVGDTRQRIYQHRQSFSECGINIKGRSSRLRMNYRTTEEIRAAALSVLDGIEFDDMDGGDEATNGYRSLIHGPKPVIKAFPDEEKEADFLKAQIDAILAKGDELKNICLVVRNGQQLYQYQKLMKNRGISCVKLAKEKDDRNVDGLRISTMHRIKGLEFNHILIAGADTVHLPQKSLFKEGMDKDQRDEIEKTERCLLYVAMTRAKMTVTVTATGTMSRFLPNITG